MENFDPLDFFTSDNHKLSLGDLVSIDNKKIHPVNRGKEFIFVFCVSQHRFGFILKEYYDQLIVDDIERVPKPFVVTIPNLDFYWTPKLGLSDVKKIK